MTTTTPSDTARNLRSSGADRRRSSPEKQALFVCRRLNIAMLTTQRGSKNTLARLAGTTGSRISLMTAGHKPVSDPFAHAIEDGLDLPRGWLDQSHTSHEVPSSAWRLLGIGFPPPTVSSKQGQPPRTNRTTQGKEHLSPSALFDKPAGELGPIAEALAKKVLQLSMSGQLTEGRAFQLLGLLFDDAADT